jgi:hypothetical protein
MIDSGSIDNHVGKPMPLKYVEERRRLVLLDTKGSFLTV